ncbi:RmlC-like cupin domain-containing protein [Cadophora sp. MPI-SDFR-AT-0126]|nr:RmlC-like cupin domain-containing protein [Leotiomycetes sp. MPI-SDFR-AT-0126]
MQQFEFHDAISHPNRSWVQIEPKIYEMLLNSDPATGRRTLLQKHEPGSLNAKESLHDYIEEIYIVEGDLKDVPRGETYLKGYYAYRKPGMVHGPFASEGGCLMFITCTPVGEEK